MNGRDGEGWMRSQWTDNSPGGQAEVIVDGWMSQWTDKSLWMDGGHGGQTSDNGWMQVIVDRQKS